MNRPAHGADRAWDALGIGPRWLVTGPASAKEQALPPGEPVAATEVADEIQPEAPRVKDPSDQGPGNRIAQMTWTELQSAVSDCQRCGLCESRKRTVYGVGDVKPRWLVVGEAPGAQEDVHGVPFVGEAGQLLDAMLASVGVSRESGVFILNVLKCRPPGNRDPAPDEVASCADYLHRQVALLKPGLIFTMGRFAAQALLQTTQGIGALRQQVHQVQIGSDSVPLVAGYHPAYLLRRPEEKMKAWQDICLARSVCDPAVLPDEPAPL